ncbi:MAG: CPBP family intramembrane metalloprotease [Bacteroidales bacterium]|nr:CPBP family intramembrane metalloprotease [Bacteroidales bacterium]
MTNKYFTKAFLGKNCWWRYIIMIAIVFVVTQLGSIPFSIVAAAQALSKGLELNSSNLTDFSLLGINSNLGLFLMLIPFAAGLIAFILLIKPLHERSITDTLTGRNKFDFSRFFFAIGVWGGLMIISLIVSYNLNPEDYTVQFNPSQFITLFFISIVFITLQATFEEVIFRGYFQQGLAVLTKNTWIPLIVTSVLFGVMHLTNPEVKEYGVALMLPQYITLGLVFAICVIMDEGLEIAIGVHVVNNVLSSLLVTHDSSVLQTPAILKAEVVDPVFSLYELLIFSGIFLFIISYKYKWGSFKKLFAKITPEVSE